MNARPKPPRPADGNQSQLVQDLLMQVRQLKVEGERLRLEARETRAQAGRPDPRLKTLETENQRLREELAAARAERDELRSGLQSLLQVLRRR